ncbi:MAG: DNA primase DnaG [Thermoplasmatota archaeon]
MTIDPATTKYMIKATIKADGVIEKSDVVGAIFGQTEGLLGDELDLRELQRSARVGRIEVELESKNGKSSGTITLPTSLDKVETVILAAAFESIDRVGPCKATISAEEVEDVRVARRKKVIERAKILLNKVLEEGKMEGESIADNVRQAVQIEEIINFGPDHCPAGPHIEKSDAIILVEGRRDVLNLLRYGIKNVIAVGGTNVPKTVVELTKERITTAFVDGDRGGELILKELLQTADIDFVARAPQTREVEEIPQKLVMKSLKNKIPAEQYAEMYDIAMFKDEQKESSKKTQKQSNNKSSSSSSSQKKSSSKTKSSDYFSILDEVSGSLKAVLLDKKDKELKKIPVRELTDELKKSKNIETVVFDGIITQRLLDIAHNKNVKTVVGMKMGNVVKTPKSVNVITKKSN